MLYTGKGDGGTTKLFGCTDCVAKGEPRIDALGNVDELNSWLGLCAACATAQNDTFIASALVEIQNDLFVIQAALAGAAKALNDSALVRLEKNIASVENELEPIHSFTIPGATMLSGALDVARTVARRAERSVVALEDPSLVGIVPYLNRLSSALFAFARLAAFCAGAREKSPWY